MRLLSLAPLSLGPFYVVLRIKNPVAVCISPKAREAYLTTADKAGVTARLGRSSFLCRSDVAGFTPFPFRFSKTSASLRVLSGLAIVDRRSHIQPPILVSL